MPSPTLSSRTLSSPAFRRRRLALSPPALALCLCLAALPSRAATLCGTVRDALTNQPVPRAGIFLRNLDWTYTGLYAASATDGAWCLDPVTPGTYHLDVRVDDYSIAVVRDVVVTGSASGVDVSVQPPAVAIDAPWPNPATGSVNFRLRLGQDGPAFLAVFDLAGRRLRAWADDHAAAGERTLAWDFRDDRGREVPAGRYYLRLEAAGRVVTAPVVRVR